QLGAMPGVAVHDLGAAPCSIVTFTIDGHTADEIKRALAAQGINVSISTASATLLDMQARGLTQVIRASVHYYNTADEIASLCAVLEALIYAG
ncbi:MAG: aminotransferase class V-fold PLP-dependent enzyme, partial [Anaerolineae bacterium]|nr:aminotransferase class V-fold PLP-dependent enzyme [Anaerolineae bacterium]